MNQNQNIKVMTNVNQESVIQNHVRLYLEKTPKWLKNRGQEKLDKETTKEEQEQFEKERAAFREQLKRDWEED